MLSSSWSSCNQILYLQRCICICNLDVLIVISYQELVLLFIFLESRGYTNTYYQELVPFTQGSVQQHQVLPFILFIMHVQ